MKKKQYTIVFVMARFRGCILQRSFPWEVREVKSIENGRAIAQQKAVQFGKGREGCIKWIEAQAAEFVEAKEEVISQ